MTTTKNLTEAQIEALRREAAEDENLGMTHACDVALGREDTVTTGEQWEERYGGGGHSGHEMETVMSIESRDDALALIVDALSDAAAQSDD